MREEQMAKLYDKDGNKVPNYNVLVKQLRTKVAQARIEAKSSKIELTVRHSSPFSRQAIEGGIRVRPLYSYDYVV